MAVDYFVRPSAAYVRQLDLVAYYIHQSAIYLQHHTPLSYDEAVAFVKRKLTDKSFPGIVDPTVAYFERNPHGDRTKQRGRLSHYLKQVVQENAILAPSWTCYVHPSVKQSHISGFVIHNMLERKKDKREAQQHFAEKRYDQYAIKDRDQTNKKLTSNSCSGAFVTQGCVLHNPTGHSTLTSLTRTVSAFGNAASERVVTGNRHYWSPDTTLYNLISIVSATDTTQLDRVIAAYGLVYPTAEDTLACVSESTRLYWIDRQGTQRLHDFIATLTPTERAAVVYTGDLYHLRVHNPTVIRTFLDTLCAKVTTPLPDAAAVMKQISGMQLNLAHHICLDEVRGCGKNIEKLAERGVLDTVASTALHINTVLADYQDFLAIFFLTDNVPPSVAHLKHMVRRCVLVSDTDSTCGSYQDWVQWHRGSVVFDTPAMALAAGVMTITTESVRHILALFSANVNVAPEHLHTLEMKNEFTWTLMCPTNVSKHYYAETVVRESDVFDTPALEIKGVHLKNSSTAKHLVMSTQTLIQGIFETIRSGRQLSLLTILHDVGLQEQAILASIHAGESLYYRKAMIKEADAYKLTEDKSPYQHYHFWSQLFAPMYGEIPPPPYVAVKLPTTLSNKTKLQAWISQLSDPSLADRFRLWCQARNKTTLPTICLPAEFLQSNGMLPELAAIIDSRRVILDLMKIQYIVLETLGYYLKPNQLVSDSKY